MAYALPADVRQVLAPDGSNDATLGTAASLDDGDLNDHIEEAQTEVDARLSSRYEVPFTTVPLVVKKITRDIAAYLATLTYRRNVPLPAEDPVRLRYARALEMLKAIGKGEIDLTTTTGEVAGESEAAVVNTLGFDEDTSIFTPEGFGLTVSGVSLPWAPERRG